MTRTNSIGLNVTSTAADGFTIGGGLTNLRTLTLSGGNIIISAPGSYTYTLPSMSDTLVGIGTSITGDVTGSITASSVTGIRGIVVSPTAPTAAQVLTYDSANSRWTPSGVVSNVIGVCSLLTNVVGSVIQIGSQNLQGDVTGSITASSVTGLRGKPINATAPTINTYMYFDGTQWTSSAGGISTSVIMVGDVTGDSGSNSVTGIRGIVVASTLPTASQVLTYDGTKWSPSSVLTNVIGVCSLLVSTNGTVISVGAQSMQGDVTGSITASSVTGIRGIVVNPTAPTTNQVLMYDGTKYSPTGFLTNVIGICSMLISTNGTVISVGTQTMQGDVTGGLTANSVTGIRGKAVIATAPTLNQTLEYDGTSWNVYTQSGDVTGSISAQSVTGIRGIVVSPTAPTATQVLTYDGSKWTPSAVVSNVVGICSLLASVNGSVIQIGAQTMQGDVTGGLTANSVTGIRGIVVNHTAPTTNQVLMYDGTQYSPTGFISNVVGICSMLVSTNGTVISVGAQSMQGDVTGSITASSVTAIRGIVVSPTLPTVTQVLTYDGTKWAPSAVSQAIAMAGDVTGTLGSNSVTAIRGKVIGTTAPTDGQALVWSATNSQWLPASVQSIGWNYVNNNVLTVGLSANTGYLIASSGSCIATLPTVCTTGTIIEIITATAAAGGSWNFRIAQNANQQIIFGLMSTTVGTGGFLQTMENYSSIKLMCINANLLWSVTNAVGNFNIS